MSKELPYFKFNPSEWFEGDITLENVKTQGFFILLCAWYWKKDCKVDLKFINKRLINGKAMLKQCLNDLIDSGIVKVDDSQNINISFLDEQLEELTEKRNKRVEAGRKGGKAMLKQSPSILDKEVDKDKEVDIKEDKSIPTFEEFKSYALEKDKTIIESVLKLKYEAWIENGWKDGNNKKILNWKTKLLNTIPFLKKDDKYRNTDQKFTPTI